MPPEKIPGLETKTIYVHNFLDLCDVRSNDNFVESPSFYCFGHEWKVEVFPGGREGHAVGWVVAKLVNCSSKKISIYWVATVEKDGSDLSQERPVHDVVEPCRGPGCLLIKRSKLFKQPHRYLQNGSLAIKIGTRLSSYNYSNRIPPQSLNRNNMKIFLDEETADIAFNLKGELIHAHKSIIKAQAEDLYVICDENTETKPLLINDVDPGVFKVMTRSLYGGFILPEEWVDHSEAFLFAAGKYGFSTVRSEAEAWYSKSLKFTVDNAVDEFLKADGNSCNLLRDAAKKFIVEHAKEIVESESFARLHESLPLMKEVMSAVADSGTKRKHHDE
jgi:hypothetical protein